MAFSTAYPTTLANLAAGNEPLSILDGNFTPVYTALNTLNTYGNYYVDTGAANAYVITLTAQQALSLAAGLPIQFKAASANTTASTLAANGTAAKAIVRQDGTALLAGDIAVTGIISVMYDGTNYVLLSPYAVSSTSSLAVPVRQTVLSGPLSAAGLPNFGGATASSIVTMTGTIVATSANGFGTSGAVDTVGVGANLSWTGLTVNGIMYLYVTVAGGALTTGSTSIAPVYQWGGTPSSIANTPTFNIQAMTGYYGSGSLAPQSSWVAMGEVFVAGGTVSTITWYALMGRYEAAFTATLPASATAVSFNHNIGDYPRGLQFEAQCTTNDTGFVVGDRVTQNSNVSSGSNPPMTLRATYKTCAFTSGGTAGWEFQNPSTGVLFAPTAGSWKYRMTAYRGW